LEYREHTGADVAASDATPFRQLGRRKAYEEVVDQIRERIFNASVKTGERLPTERDLAVQFGVSRVVVREAVRALELAGMLRVKKGPKGGIFVAEDHQRPITDSIGNLLARGEARLKDLFEVRRLIEPYAAERVARIGTARDFDELAAVVAQARSAQGDVDAVRELNIETHRRIIRMARNPVLAAVGETVLLMLSERLRPVKGRAAGRVLDLHRDLLQAFRERDAKAARAIMEKDIAAVGKHYALLDAKGNSPRRKE
jgi:GntR family transcriptional regulator, transcriptional repressor for pyruvate dehydrogenase complex